MDSSIMAFTIENKGIEQHRSFYIRGLLHLFYIGGVSFLVMLQDLFCHGHGKAFFIIFDQEGAIYDHAVVLQKGDNLIEFIFLGQYDQ